MRPASSASQSGHDEGFRFGDRQEHKRASNEKHAWQKVSEVCVETTVVVDTLPPARRLRCSTIIIIITTIIIIIMPP